MNPKMLLYGIVTLAAILVADPAHAWVHACNQTSNPIWISYGDEPTNGSVFDYGDNGCNSSSAGSIHASGWYKVNPGACATVNGGKAYLFSHWFYVEDGQGHVWDGGYLNQYAMCAPWTAYSRCTFLEYGTAFCDVSQRSLHYMSRSTSATNYTINFRL